MFGLTGYFNCKHCYDSEHNIYKDFLDNLTMIILLTRKSQKGVLRYDEDCW